MTKVVHTDEKQDPEKLEVEEPTAYQKEVNESFDEMDAEMGIVNETMYRYVCDSCTHNARNFTEKDLAEKQTSVHCLVCDKTNPFKKENLILI